MRPSLRPGRPCRTARRTPCAPCQAVGEAVARSASRIARLGGRGPRAAASPRSGRASSRAASSVASGGHDPGHQAAAPAPRVAVIVRPVRMSSIALALPIARVSRCVPPAPGMTPSRISGWPNWRIVAGHDHVARPSRARSRHRARSRGPPRSSGSPIARDPVPACRTGRRRRATRMSARPSSRMSAPAANARSPAPVMTIARQRRVGVEASRARPPARRAGRSSSALSALGRSSVTRATPSSSVAGAADAGAGAGYATRTSRACGASPSAVPGASLIGAVSVNDVLDCVPTVSTPGKRPCSHVRRVLEHEERREARCDLAQIPAGARIASEPRPASSAARSSKRIVVTSTRSVSPPSASTTRWTLRLPQSGRPRDERQVLVRVASLEGRVCVRAALGTAVEREQGRHRSTSSGCGSARRRAPRRSNDRSRMTAAHASVGSFGEVVAGVRCHEQAAVAHGRGPDRPPGRPGRAGRDRRTATSVGAVDRAELGGRQQRLCGDVGGDRRQQARARRPRPGRGRERVREVRGPSGSSRSIRLGSISRRATLARGSRAVVIPTTTSVRSRSGTPHRARRARSSPPSRSRAGGTSRARARRRTPRVVHQPARLEPPAARPSASGRGRARPAGSTRNAVRQAGQLAAKRVTPRTWRRGAGSAAVPRRARRSRCRGRWRGSSASADDATAPTAHRMTAQPSDAHDRAEDRVPGGATDARVAAGGDIRRPGPRRSAAPSSRSTTRTTARSPRSSAPSSATRGPPRTSSRRPSFASSRRSVAAGPRNSRAPGCTESPRISSSMVAGVGRSCTGLLGRLVDRRTEPPPDDSYPRAGSCDERSGRRSPRCRVDARVALLLAAHGFSGREVADALGRSELATRSLICRARLRLRERLDGTEVFA